MRARRRTCTIWWRSWPAAPATAHMFIVNPLSGHGMDSLFATDPSTENRIAALQRLAGQFNTAGVAPTPRPVPASSAMPRGPWDGQVRRGPWG